MTADALERLHDAFLTRVASAETPPGQQFRGGSVPEEAVGIFRAQCRSRHLDRAARALQAQGRGYYTIGSSGHEGMAAVAAALRPTDMAFLHYRDAAFQIARAQQVPGQDPVRDILLSLTASADDPISGGRHKVLGSKALMIPPQTSTIASHLPKAVGAAYSIGLNRRLKSADAVLDPDGVVLCSFGDASANHSTAQGAINTACWTSYQNVPLPLVLVCEDNGIGISVRTPDGWIASTFGNRPGLTYMAADGLDLAGTFHAARDAADHARRKRRPVFLHLRTVRLGGHAGSDVEAAYLTHKEIAANEQADPLARSAEILMESGTLDRDAVLDIYSTAEAEVFGIMDAAASRPRLGTADQVMASLIPPARSPARPNRPEPEARMKAFGSDHRAISDPQPMNRLINWALTDLMLQHPHIVLSGEDVGRKGGVYGVTRGLCDRFGRDRVIDTLLDEQSILGLAIGMAHNGILPIPEIQFLAYLHNAEDQLRGEAATLPFFSDGQFANPMVVRIAGLGYQRGFGGHFHNDNSLAVLRDIPGLILACPSDGAEAVRMLRECVRLAQEEQRLVVFLEPIALYPMRDLHEAGDGGWLRHYPPPGETVPFGEVSVTGDGDRIAIVTYGNGAYLSRRAAARLEGARVVDLRWLAPLPEASILSAVEGCGAVLVVDECRRSGNVSEALMTLLAENGHGRIARVTARDSFIATGPAYAATLPDADDIVAAALSIAP